MNKINKIYLDFFYKIPLKQVNKLMKRMSSNFDVYNDEQGNIVYHAESEQYNGDIWIEIDPKNKDVVFIEGNGRPFEIIDGMRKRWNAFEDVYKYMKELEVMGEFERLKEQYNEDFGGKMNILDENSGEMKEKNINIGTYIIKTSKNPLKDIKIPEKRKITSLTVNNKLLLNDSVSYPLIGIISDNKKEKVGTIKHETIKDGFGKNHYVLKLYIDDNVDYKNEHISQFSKKILDFIKDNGLKIEGVLPDDKIRYDENGMRKFVLIENNEKFMCVNSEILSLNNIKLHQNRTNINVILSSLEYEEEGIIDLSDIQAGRILLKSKNDDDFSVATVNMGGLRNRKIIIESNKQTEKAVLRLFNMSPFECEIPDVEAFFKDKKETYVEFNTPFDKIIMETIKENNVNKAQAWVINFPVDTKEKKIKLFDFFIKMKDNKIDFPDKVIFNQGFLFNNRIVKGGIDNKKIYSVIDRIKNEIQHKIDKITEFPEL